jgi:phosphate transport system substrate-binding protein
VRFPISTRYAALAAAVVLTAAACGGAATPEPTGQVTPTGEPLAGEFLIDGSSTVYPITEAIAEEFQLANQGVLVTVAFSGTSAGFQKFCRGESVANDASRPIKQEEIDACSTAGITPVELPVAYDGLSVMVNPANDWVSCLTVSQLNLIWDQGSPVQNWSDVDPSWPNEKINLYGPGADSGTFDYFTEEINGETDRSRSDYTQSEDDNSLVQGIAGDTYALGYFGYAYYQENADRLKVVPIDAEEGGGCVEPTPETISGLTYVPLSRPLFIYPSKEALQRPEVEAFFRYYLANVDALLGTGPGQVGYIQLHDDLKAEALSNLEAALQ